MSTKVKAFIGITVSFVVLIILFASNGGYRAARDASATEDYKKSETCCAVSTVESETK